MQAGKKQIEQIFIRSNNIALPFFQRSYVWGEEQWERFLEDMYFVCETKMEYFLGSVILKEQGVADTQNKVHLLVDGQQRLTTLNIFFKILFLKLNEAKEFDSLFRKRNGKLILTHNVNDISAFEKVLNIEYINDLQSPTNQIEECYCYFRDNMDINRLNYGDLLKNITFVGVDLDEHENEQQIFDTINSLGVRLTTADLLKNLLFSSGEIDLYQEHWKNVFEKDEEVVKYWNTVVGRDNKTLIDVFLLSFLQLKAQELGLSSAEKTNFSVYYNLFNSYKRLLLVHFKDNKLDLLKDLRDYAIIFKNHIDPDIEDKVVYTPLDRMNFILFKLETAVIIPYILFVIKNTLDKEQQRNELFSYIESFLMRRMVSVDGDFSKEYKNFFNERLINNNIVSKTDFISYLQAIRGIGSYMPNDDGLLYGFSYKKMRQNQIIGILYLIETGIRDLVETKKLNINHVSQLLSVDKYSLEYLMPKKWQKNWGKTSYPDERDRIILTLGNTAIFPQKINPSLRDANWSTKRLGNNRNKGLLYYAKGLITSQAYVGSETWDERNIEARAKDLCKLAKLIWHYEV